MGEGSGGWCGICWTSSRSFYCLSKGIVLSGWTLEDGSPCLAHHLQGSRVLSFPKVTRLVEDRCTELHLYSWTGQRMQTLESELLQLQESGVSLSTGQRRETGLCTLLQREIPAQEGVLLLTCLGLLLANTDRN